MDEKSSPTWMALSDAILDDNHELVWKHARDLLTADPENDLAAHCLLVASLQISDLDEASNVLDRYPNLLPETLFDRAYLLYRQRRFQEAIDLLEALPDVDERSLQLRALLAARLGKNDIAADIYKKFLEQLSDEDDENYRAELLSNFLAVCSPSDTDQALQKVAPEHRTFTMIYNKACSKITIGDFASADKLLNRAATLCRKADLSEKELIDELSPIQVQLAYTRQMQGFPNEAKELYQSVLEMVPPGIHSQAIVVACLNLMSLRHRDEKHFDSAKRLARALKADSQKLSDFQIAAIDKNQVLLLLFEKQFEGCVLRCQEILGKDPRDHFVALVLACALSRSKQIQAAVEVLQKYRSIDTQLALVQILLEEKESLAALDALRDPILTHLHTKPAFVSLVVSLQDNDSAVQTVMDAVSKDPALVDCAASFFQRIGKSEKALEILSDAVEVSSQNWALLKSLIITYFSIGREIPSDIFSRLPSVPLLSPDEIAAYELAAVSVLKVSRKKCDPAATSSVKKAKKKKKKIRYPKGFDPKNPGPPPDPERWISRHERTQGRRRNQVSMKGPQGSLPSNSVFQGSGRSRATRATEDKNVSDNQRQKIHAASSGSVNSKANSKKKGKKRR